ncbi:hypothetical protein BHF71_07225 [Vulcanibacillus modesticaldus]|uniref:Uncharacterized protein n=1 Tax=Vulcanibacillus modesticaldus TaxID=337097 RepID=A0A1D2YW85_9BACI|nr:hypothetical protein [Vulcanibacillus modesticaldus]OEF99895.1 hypothetical protein BHF71_07225 [Vulcanibacillus modesticaldus]
MRKFLSILLVLVVLVIGAIPIIGLLSSEPPIPTITVGDKEVTTVQGSYCWSGLLKAKCVDMISPPEIIKHAGLRPVVVSPEAQLTIEFKNEPKKNTLGANRWINNEETEVVQLNDNVLTVPKENGVYVYNIFASWEKGNSSYVFVIEVR